MLTIVIVSALFGSAFFIALQLQLKARGINFEEQTSSKRIKLGQLIGDFLFGHFERGLNIFKRFLFPLFSRFMRVLIRLYIQGFHHVNKKIQRVVRFVQGRHVSTKKGTVSLFLQDLIDHKDTVKEEIKG